MNSPAPSARPRWTATTLVVQRLGHPIARGVPAVTARTRSARWRRRWCASCWATRGRADGRLARGRKRALRSGCASALRGPRDGAARRRPGELLGAGGERPHPRTAPAGQGPGLLLRAPRRPQRRLRAGRRRDRRRAGSRHARPRRPQACASSSPTPAATRMLWARSSSGEYPVFLAAGLLTDGRALSALAARPGHLADVPGQRRERRRRSTGSCSGHAAGRIAIPAGEAHKTRRRGRTRVASRC